MFVNWVSTVQVQVDIADDQTIRSHSLSLNLICEMFRVTVGIFYC
jgi:hypothetical protein